MVNTSDTVFDANEWQRYQRQIQLNSFGVDGQVELKKAKVLIVGAGGLGCPVAQYLSAAGVGNIILVDADTISRSNLHRQILYTESDVGKNKSDTAAERMRAINPNIKITPVAEHLSPNNIETLAQGCNLILDCTDDIRIRYLINDHSIKTQTPWIYASVERFNGQLTIFNGESACFRCLFPEPPFQLMDCNSAGVLGTVPGILASLQANEAVKFLAKIPSKINGQLLIVDSFNNDFRYIKLKKNSKCPCSQDSCDFPDAQPPAPCSVTLAELPPKDFNEKLSNSKSILVDVRSANEHNGFNIGGCNININDEEDKNNFEKLENKHCTVLLYCQSGLRSHKAKEYMQSLGFNDVHSLQGGLENWLDYFNT